MSSLPQLLETALARLRAGDPRGALAPLGAALEAEPTHAAAWYLTGLALSGVGDSAQAEAALRRATALAPQWPEPWVQLGAQLAARGVRDEPVACWRAALALAPDHVDAGVRLGTALAHLGALDEAEAVLRRVLARAPGHAAAAGALARVLEGRGDDAGAWALLAPAAAADPQAAVAAAAIAPRVGRAAEALVTVDAALSAASGAARSLLLHARGDLCHALDRPDDAFAAWAEGNASRGLAFDPAQHRRAVAHLIARTPARARPAFVPEAERPVLIVGVPRTGSTLLEQALGRHPAVAAGGELEALRDVAVAARRPPEGDWADGLERIVASDAPALRARYLAALSAVHPDAPRVTDKMPNNLLHLGLLGAILPGARVIRLRRDPTDTAFSCFRQPLGAGLPWATSLAGIAAWIACADQLLDHWAATAPIRLFDVRYEDLVARPEPTLAAVCAFLDLPFDSAVLTPERSTRVAATASAVEVRAGIHARSIGRSDRYHAHMRAYGWTRP